MFKEMEIEIVSFWDNKQDIENNLIQLSAGSGKSNSITWAAAYQLTETFPESDSIPGSIFHNY
jgi:type I site-specific restriction-modification system R (restriction) subunit